MACFNNTVTRLSSQGLSGPRFPLVARSSLAILVVRETPRTVSTVFSAVRFGEKWKADFRKRTIHLQRFFHLALSFAGWRSFKESKKV